MKRIVRIILIIILLEILGSFLIQKKTNIQSPVEKITSTSAVTPEPVMVSKPTIPSLENGGFNSVVKEKTLKKTTPTPVESWGVAKQIDEHTWTMKVGNDEKMATSQEILEALNEYRKVHGSQILTMDEKLKNYAQERAKYLNEIKSVDQHKGFNDFVENQDGFNKLGFTSLGENISYGYKLTGVHIIEWMYAGDEPHNKNQLDNRWNYAGVGVDGLATCLIFGTGKF